MKIVIFTLMLVSTSLLCRGQATPEYEYAVLKMDGRDWDIYYEDSTHHIDSGPGTYFEESYARFFRALHYLNSQGYELITCAIYRSQVKADEYYFKRLKRK